MKVLAVGRPRPGVDARTEIARLARKELPTLWALYRDGLVREIYSPGGPGVILLLEADGPGPAKEALANLPLVAEGVVDFELLELRPFTGWQLLFTRDPK